MMPWEKPPVQDSLEIPAILKRDANNIAPYMRIHEGNPVPESWVSKAMALNPANSPQPKAQAVPLPWEPKT